MCKATFLPCNFTLEISASWNLEIPCPKDKGRLPTVLSYHFSGPQASLIRMDQNVQHSKTESDLDFTVISCIVIMDFSIK